MGLGKTLSMLALICGSLDIQTQDTEAGKTLKTPGTTLVVTPLSSMCSCRQFRVMILTNLSYTQLAQPMQEVRTYAI